MIRDLVATAVLVAFFGIIVFGVLLLPDAEPLGVR